MTLAARLALIPVDPGTKKPFGAFIQGRTYNSFAPGTDERGTWGGETGHVVSESVRLVALDLDGTKNFDDGAQPPQFADTALGKLLHPLLDYIVTYRKANGDAKAHVYIEPPDGAPWTTQWATHEWAYDWKSAGFVRAEPSYEWTGTGILRPDRALWDQIAAALKSDQFEYGKWACAHNTARQGSVRSGKSIAEWMTDNGYTAYDQIPDNSMAGDNDLSALVASMYASGADEEDIYATWDRVSYAKGTAWTIGDYERHLYGSGTGDSGAQKFSETRAQAIVSMESNDSLAEAKEDLPAPTPTVAVPGPSIPVYGAPAPSAEPFTLRNGTDQYLGGQILRLFNAWYIRTLDTGAWFRYDEPSKTWKRCADDPCDEMVARIAAQLSPPEKRSEERIAEGTAGKDDPLTEDEKLFARLNQAKQCSGVIAKMRTLAKTQAYLNEEDFDANPFIFWAGGVPYDLRTCAPSDNAQRGHQLTAAYAPADGPTPLWDALNEAQFPDFEVREYALNVFASILPGGSNKLLPNFKADGNLGKTTRLEMIKDVLGSYSVQLPVQLLGNYSGHDELYLRLKGKRLACMDETPPSGKVATEKLKHLSGGGQLTGRAINGRLPITFTMQHTLFLAGNDDLPLTDVNVQRRIRYLPIEGDKEAIKRVGQALWDHGQLSGAWRTEAPAVLWKLMQRASRVLADRSLCDMPSAALDHFADAILEQDTVGAFVSEMCTQGGETKAGFLYEAYVDWCKRNAERSPATRTAFGRRLNEMGYEGRRVTAGVLRPLKLQSMLY
jgi:hypothetical protein